MVRYLLVLRRPRRRVGDLASLRGSGTWPWRCSSSNPKRRFYSDWSQMPCNVTEHAACERPACTEDPTESSNRMLYKSDVVMAEIPKSATLYVVRTVGEVFSPH